MRPALLLVFAIVFSYTGPAAAASRESVAALSDKRLQQIFAARVELVMPQIRKLSLALEAANAAQTAGTSGAPQ